MISFANPTFLWTLLGLSIPITIHLLSRKEGQVIRMGSLRHVQETSTQQFKGIRLNEILLLAIRLLIIICLSMMLSGLQFGGGGDQKWVVVESGVEKNLVIKSMVDSLVQSGYELHSLSSLQGKSQGSSPLNGDRHVPLEAGLAMTEPDEERVNYYSFVNQIQKENLSDAVVFAYNRANQFSGKRTYLPDNIKWIGVTPDSKEYVVRAVQQNENVLVRVGKSDAMTTTFDNREVKSVEDSIQLSPSIAYRIAIVSDEDQTLEPKILSASLKAIDEISPDSFILSERMSSEVVVSDSIDWCFWLSTKKNTSQSKTKTVFIDSNFSNQLIEQTGPTQWVITKPLNEETALKENLTVSLASLLTFREDLQEVAEKNDQRVMPDSELWSSASGDLGNSFVSNSNTSATAYLLMLLLLLLAVERFVSYQRNQ